MGYYPQGTSCVDRILFVLPMHNPGGAMIGDNVFGFDNDPDEGWSDIDCQNYQGFAFPACYDGHSGTDFMLEGGFVTMDAGSTAVLAAAAGEVIATHDGEFDRCQADIWTQEVVCPGYDEVTPPNYVRLRHADGQETRYLHLKKDSVIVTVGEWVECGQELALVGSSGNSSGPHLHFTLRTEDGVNIDPFSGPASHPESYWVEQDGANGLPSAACPP
jgi:murein DD-endopeptidase MepM/ murein hydrolase activator NlpD